MELKNSIVSLLCATLDVKSIWDFISVALAPFYRNPDLSYSLRRIATGGRSRLTSIGNNSL
jgi:hypothetical protein